ncbi:4Fe-4S dicluster domain-containing protein [Candidatus Bathyarchaeota archaeon]|nr:4Fe-4S dicluster domain-containing protein [Candidatus Bathyarchaeota archaeon]
MAEETYVITVDPQKCLACKTCEFQCAIEHSGVSVYNIPKEKPPKYIHVEGTTYYSLPIQCQHCEKAPCVAVCPAKAITNVEGIVLIDSEKCIGCKYCIYVCPFGVLEFNRKAKLVSKCDLCLDKLKKGLKPICVASCPTKALTYGKISELLKTRREALFEIVKGAVVMGHVPTGKEARWPSLYSIPKTP